MLRLLVAVLVVCIVAMTRGQKGQHGQQGQQEDPCKNYVSTVDQRRSAKYKLDESIEDGNICDRDINENVWYRFQGLPPYRIHDACPQPFHCGTAIPVWLSGTHPTANDPGPKEVDVCSSEGTNCCRWKSKIQVKYCSAGDDGFYVYLLKRVPQCDMAYCAGNVDVCTGGNVWNPGRNACTHEHPHITLPVFVGPTTERKTMAGTTEEYDDFYFSCNVQWTDQEKPIQKGEQFEVVFTFDGIQVDSVPPKITDGSNLNVRLSSREIKGHVGKTIRCLARAYWKLLEVKATIQQASTAEYFVGIKFSLSPDGPFDSQPIQIKESEPPKNIYFQPTVPVSCPDTTVPASCKFSIKMADIKEKDKMGMTSCSITFSGSDAGKKLPAQIIQALSTPGIVNRASVLSFLLVDTNPEFFWHGYQLPAISITIKDAVRSAVCQSTGDPHITTFDKRYYHVFLEGDFLFAKSTRRNFEVHVRLHKYGPRATCNCAVAVREGNNILGVNFCQGPKSYPTPITYLKDDNVPGATITLKGNSYTITMPSGAYLRADYERNSIHNSILDLYLHLNNEDHGQTSGLCGVWNENSNDDTVPKGSTTNDAKDYPVTFSNSYRLTAEESFLNGHVRPIGCLNTKDLMPNICTCTAAKAVTCDAPDPKTTTFVTKFTQNCNVAQQDPTKTRKERDVDSSNEIDETDNRQDDLVLAEADIPIPKVDENHGADFAPLWPTASGITEVIAQNHCRNQMQKSPVYEACKGDMANHEQLIVDSCVTDAMAMDNLTLASAFIVNNFQRICVHEFEINVVHDGSSALTTTDILLANLVSMICLNQCSGNGNCQKGTCVCNAGFSGDDCSVITSNPPKLSSFRRDVKCDLRSSYCQETSIFASNFFYSEKFRCKITEVDRSKHVTLGGFLISGGEVVCKLPAVYRFTDERAETNGTAEAEVGPAPFYRWDIALTNDGNLYSNSLRMTVYDSKCQEIRPDGTTTQKVDTCVIDGRCYRSGEASRLNRCNKCFPNKSHDRWTHDETEKVCPPNAATSLCYTFSVFTAAILVSFFRIGA